MTKLDRDGFVARLREEGHKRYHDKHPFHQRMHAGKLGKADLQRWVRNRFYYQSRLPIKDALIVAKSDDSEFRRVWTRRIVDQDGAGSGEGGLEQWLKLGEGLSLDRKELLSLRDILPGVRFACDAYVGLVRDASLVEAVASALTELFSPDLMQERAAAWERHYSSFVPATALEYFRARPAKARGGADFALEFVLKYADTADAQERCINAVARKCEILWAMLDSIHAG
jgi:pyrroloquinoline-quinone synthase